MSNFRNRLYDLIVGEFMRHAAKNPKFTQAALARRLRSRPEVVNRWLSSPGNWTLDTVSYSLLVYPARNSGFPSKVSLTEPPGTTSALTGCMTIRIAVMAFTRPRPVPAGQ